MEPDWPILCPEPSDSPGKTRHRGSPSRQKTSKKKAPARDTRLAVGRELTKGNSIFPFFEDRNRTDCSAVNLTGAKQTLIGNLGRRFLTQERFTRDDPAKSLLGNGLIGLL